jgi:hypothetical protein
MPGLGPSPWGRYSQPRSVAPREVNSTSERVNVVMLLFVGKLQFCDNVFYREIFIGQAHGGPAFNTCTLL